MVKYILPKRRYTAAEAAEIILENLPIGDESDEEFDESDEEEDFQLDPLDVLNEEALEEDTDESVEVLEENETSSYYESSSDEDIPLAQVANKTIPAAEEEIAVDYDVGQNREWEKKEKTQTTIDFTLPEGPVEDHFAHCTTAGDYFLTYFDDEIRENILFQTNLYLTQRERRVPVITQSELFSFLGINLVPSGHETSQGRLGLVDIWSGRLRTNTRRLLYVVNRTYCARRPQNVY